MGAAFLAELGHPATTAASNQCLDGTTGIHEEQVMVMKENKRRRSYVTPSERKLRRWWIEAVLA